MPLKLSPQAREDLRLACDWYEGERQGLGRELLDAVDQCLETIQQHPRLFAKVHGGVRQTLVERFPFSIVYEIVDAEIAVYAVFHHANDPEELRLRISTPKRRSED